MKYQRYIVALVFTIFIVSCCQSQSKERRSKILPKVEAKINALYPNATSITPEISYITDSIQSVALICNCTEGTGRIEITLDTAGHVLDQEIHISIKDLPAAIVNYMQSNYTTGFTYNNNIVKSITNTKEVSYTVNAQQQNPDGTPVVGALVYVLKFTSSGEFISLEKQ